MWPPRRQCAAVPLQPTPCGQHGREAQNGAANAQHDNHNVPKGAMKVEKREVEAVKTLIKPATKAAHARGSLNDASLLRIR